MMAVTTDPLTVSNARSFTFSVSIRFLLHALRLAFVFTLLSTVSPGA
jgi:hypothetical protein